MKDTLSKFARIRRCQGSDIAALDAMAREDGHNLILPTHVVEKGQQMVGFVSAGALRNVFVWMHQAHTNIRDSVAVANFYENWMTECGMEPYIVPCLPSSPYYKYLKQLDGYLDLGQTNLFLKQPKI